MERNPENKNTKRNKEIVAMCDETGYDQGFAEKSKPKEKDPPPETWVEIDGRKVPAEHLAHGQ